MKGLPPSEQLLAFKLVAELESFTAAAHALNLTQSAVSHQIGRLERRIGFRLFTRSSQHLTLTDAGERYYAAIAEPLSDLMRALENLGDPMGPRRLIIQVESGFAAAWLSPRLQRFVRLHPGIQVEQRRASTLNISDGIELAVKWGNGHWPHYDAEKLLQVDYTPICSPQLASTEPRIYTPNDLRRQTLIHDRQYREWHLWFKLAGVKGADAKRGHVVDDTNLVIDLAISGQGVALCSPQLAKRAIDAGQLVVLFPEFRLQTDEAYYLVTKKGSDLSPRAEAFADWLRAEINTYDV
ncbi:LysR family transcriptional regulator [Rhizobium sp. 16-449-1b]|uniref:LysR substrate-binding domain-containing protein n=1 Tax=Rhizobium sp. 16-449-1b TaxID=2819989 RepID=UPI001ADA524A|nr:LysR substrate-binding domain-containing protein [Rhizobium sp. 16-449-1b]MBO9195428.1 LysR family transcriptional regulator [Rhizobium sp. 16-449-1b]